jgi:CheY-like chemotaxis protein
LQWDIEMPVMDGLTACHRIREMEDSGELIRRVPVIAVTANARQERVERMISEGFDEVLTKPFRVPHLLAAIQKLLQRVIGQGEQGEQFRIVM